MTDSKEPALSRSGQLTVLATLESLRVVKREDDAHGYMRWSVLDASRLPKWCGEIAQNGYLMISKTANRRKR